MKKLRACLMLLVLLCMCGCTANSSIQVYDINQQSIKVNLTMNQVPSRYYKESRHPGTIEKFWYTTRTYGINGREDKEIQKYAEVYLPYGYDSSKQYDIMYLMHGAGGSAERFFGSTEDPSGLKNVVDNMIERGKIKPMIFVGLTYYPNNDWDEEEDERQYTKQYNKELINDVLPQVEGHYATYATSNDEAGLKAARRHRIFGGYSMGAVTTYYRMTDSLDYFYCFLAMSGSLYWGAEENMDENFAGQYLKDHIEEQGYTSSDFFVYTVVGTEDYALDVVRKQINSEKKYPDFFHFGNDGKTANCAYVEAAGEKHGGTHCTDRYLYNVLPVLSDILNK